MRRSPLALLVIAVAVVFWACSSGSAVGSSDASSSDTVSTATNYSVSRYVKGANQAVGLAFDAKGRLLYNEKDSGRIIRFSKGKKTVLAKLNISGGGEAGLLGLTADKSGNVYAYYTGTSSSCPDPTKSSAGGDLKGHCVWAFKPTSGGKLKSDHLVFSANHPSSAQNHVGGGLHIGPDGALYLSIGDLGENNDPNKGPGRAQNLGVPFGKILRLTPSAANEGESGNPGICMDADYDKAQKVSDERIWACGLRNTYQFAFDVNKNMWGSEAGDSCDEINKILAGGNYGWQPPRTDCAGSGPGKPQLELSGTPSGITVPLSRAAGAWRNDVFFCVFNEAKLVHYNPNTKKSTSLSKAQGKCSYDLASRSSYMYMSSGDAIYRLKIRS